jgi:hypothetical protein
MSRIILAILAQNCKTGKITTVYTDTSKILEESQMVNHGPEYFG